MTFQWSGPSSTWQQIGQVVDAIGSGRKQLFEGQEYDYVFDVDVSEGMPPLKLPYNVTGEALSLCFIISLLMKRRESMACRAKVFEQERFAGELRGTSSRVYREEYGGCQIGPRRGRKHIRRSVHWRVPIYWGNEFERSHFRRSGSLYR